jgi:hypothetical protein
LAAVENELAACGANYPASMAKEMNLGNLKFLTLKIFFPTFKIVSNFRSFKYQQLIEF